MQSTAVQPHSNHTITWDHVDLDADPAELYLPGGIQKRMKRDAYLEIGIETTRQLRR